MLIIALCFTMSTASVAQDVTLLYSAKTYQIYHVVEDHFDLVHFEGTLDNMSSFFLFTSLELTETKYLSMNSTGGYMTESYMLGMFLQNRPDITLMVRNDNICMSACAFAALSANKLMLGQNGLDFHTPYIPYLESETTLQEFATQSQESLLGLMEYLDQTGYGIEFLELIMEKSNKETYITFNSVTELNKFKVEHFFDLSNAKDATYKLVTR